jgi:hypothetical protein
MLSIFCVCVPVVPVVFLTRLLRSCFKLWCLQSRRWAGSQCCRTLPYQRGRGMCASERVSVCHVCGCVFGNVEFLFAYVFSYCLLILCCVSFSPRYLLTSLNVSLVPLLSTLRFLYFVHFC